MSQRDLDQLTRLVIGRHPCVLLQTLEEDYALLLLQGVADDARREMQIWSVTRGVREGLLAGAQGVTDTQHPAGAMTHLLLHSPHRSLIVFVDVASHLSDERTLRCLRELVDHAAVTKSTVVLIDARGEVPPEIAAVAAKQTLSLPDPEELTEIVKRTVRELKQESQIEVSLRQAELDLMVMNLQGLSRRQAKQAITQAICDDRRLDGSDLPGLQAFKRQVMSSMGLLEFIETPASLDDIGGLEHLKSWLNLRQRALSEEARTFGLPAPRGVLMLGVQGAGKSLSAKAVATAWQRPLLRMDVGALFDKFIGESERRLRDALKQAEMMSPVILWIDEIEKAFASAAAQSIDGGLSKRMFGALLTWMQEHSKPVFLIATANDVSALPPELLRKGRFDEIFFIDLPRLETRRQIMAIHLRKRKRDPRSFDLAELAQASEGFSGAEIEQAIISGLYAAFDAGTELNTQHVLSALAASPPLSVTMAERMSELRAWAQDRCVMAE